jgi:hypothetical protein
MAGRILDFARRLVDRYEQVYRAEAGGGQYYIMEMPRYGDISSANVTGLSKNIWQSFAEQTWAQRGLAHELIHPYVRTGTDRADPLWTVAVEGFPSYFHLPILAEILGEEWYTAYLQKTEDEYLQKRRTGRGRRNRPLPPEKPLLEITSEDLPTYKDKFVIDDRVLLFLNYLYRRMGQEDFFTFTKDLFGRTQLTAASFRALIETHLDGSADDVEIWLATTDYPERFYLKELGTADEQW